MNFQELTTGLDYTRYGSIVKVSLLDLIQNTTASCDGYDLNTFQGWQEMFSEKCSDTGFGHLVNSIVERGFMPNGAIGFDDGEITEGHHRLCASILLGLDEVYVSRWGKNLMRDNSLGSLVCAHYAEDGLEDLPMYVEL